MNIHHLELFYYVARYEGISPAVRNMPYGIQQPAISGQILQLEDYLGMTLFQRRPFRLTTEGRRLYEFIEPFFSNVDAVADELRGGVSHLIRIAASPIILRDHMPRILSRLRDRFPELKLTLSEGVQPQIEDWLQNQQVDFGVTVLEDRPPSGIKTEIFLELPLVLMVPKSFRVDAAETLWSLDRIEHALICLPGNETITRNFMKGLGRLGVSWPVSIEVNSLELMQTYVEHDFGIGVSVAIPGQRPASGTRMVPLPGFAPIKVGALWTGNLSPVVDALRLELRQHAEKLR